MRYAILIMMHKNPEQVLRLLKWYATDETVCFIHVDVKLQIDIVAFEHAVHRIKKDTIVLGNRFSGVLDTWSLVHIALRLAERAGIYETEHGINFSYYQLLSGQDYPIGNYRDFLSLLEQNYPSPYLNLCQRGSEKRIKKFDRIRYYKIRCFLTDRNVIHNVGIPVVAVVHLWEAIITKLSGSPAERLQKIQVETGFGAAWWTLPDTLIKLALQVERGECSDKLRTMLSVIKNTSTPEETFFQTLFLNSELADLKVKGNLTHCNFKEGKASTGHPCIFEVSDLEVLKYWSGHQHFFARKFDETVDSRIMDEIDSVIYGSEE